MIALWRAARHALLQLQASACADCTAVLPSSGCSSIQFLQHTRHSVSCLSEGVRCVHSCALPFDQLGREECAWQRRQHMHYTASSSVSEIVRFAHSRASRPRVPNREALESDPDLLEEVVKTDFR